MSLFFNPRFVKFMLTLVTRWEAVMKIEAPIVGIVLALLLASSTGCQDHGLGTDNGNHSRFTLYVPQDSGRNLDLLFVVDNSDSMGDDWSVWESTFSLAGELYNLVGGLPNLHIGVTSTDLGSGVHQLPGCEVIGGDQGNLLTSNCSALLGASYVVDVEPTGCEIEKELHASGTLTQCAFHNCDTSNCIHEPTTTLYVDAKGCPRCGNYYGETLASTLYCMFDVAGVSSCEFEQPLEAMYRALDGNQDNSEFLRSEAYLGVVFITDEDDCSVSDPIIFNPDQSGIDSPLGYLSSYRCFEFGVECDINDRIHVGLRQNCQPREDEGALLHPISRYVQFINGIKDPSMFAVAAVAGPVVSDSVTVDVNDDGWPEVQYSCSTYGFNTATPGIRLRAFLEAFNSEEDMAWAFTPICNSDLSSAISGLYHKLEGVMAISCLPSALKGCSDVAAWFGDLGDGQDCNDHCDADCAVLDVFERGMENEQRSDVPSCREVMPDGSLLLGNTDWGLAYSNGLPDRRDPDLPVPACWYIGYQERCSESNHAEIVISRRLDPPPFSFAEVSCAALPQFEELCDDGVDNDEDCLVDEDDADCW